MTVDEAVLWAKINRFEFDQPGTRFTFAKRLARENGWSDVYTLRAIVEYKNSFSCVVYL